jgi:hypothetical protein
MLCNPYWIIVFLQKVALQAFISLPEQEADLFHLNNGVQLPGCEPILRN